MPDEPAPVALDTDIGDDIDDMWALALLLKSPELRLELALSCTGDTSYRARLLCKFLERAGRSEVPVAIGLPDCNLPVGPQAPWVDGYRLERYPGQVHEDGVDVLVRYLMTGPAPRTLLAIGPLTNVAEALRREPAIAPRTRLVGMLGSVRVGYGGTPHPAVEYNIRIDIPAAQAVFAAPWACATITPLDTCGTATVTPAQARQLATASDPVLRMVLENHRLWYRARSRMDGSAATWQAHLTDKPLFDTLAVHLAHCRRHLVVETLRLTVDENGFTRPDSDGRPMDVAVAWRDRPGFLRELVARLCCKSTLPLVRDKVSGRTPVGRDVHSEGPNSRD